MSEAKKHWVNFTYETEQGPVTVDVGSLMPDTVYRYLCRCGCGSEFKDTGRNIQNDPNILNSTTTPAILAGGAEMFPKGPISDNLTVTANCGGVTLGAPRETHLDLSHGGDKTGIVRITTKRGHNVVMDDRTVEDEDTEDLEIPVEFTPMGGIKFDMDGELKVEAPKPEPKVNNEFDEEPMIGDIVWSKATGAGPFTIIAGTFIDVRAARLEIRSPVDGTLVRERSRQDETLQLDAWMVRNRRGRLLTFPKAELTRTPQVAMPSIAKIIGWAAFFATLIGTGWLLHH